MWGGCSHRADEHCKKQKCACTNQLIVVKVFEIHLLWLTYFVTDSKFTKKLNYVWNFKLIVDASCKWNKLLKD